MDNEKLPKDKEEEHKMEKVINYNMNEYKLHDDDCEWDIIGNIFAKAIKRKGMSKKQVDEVVKKVRVEMRIK